MKDCAATLSELYHSTCRTWVALPGVQNSSQHSYPGHWDTQSPPTKMWQHTEGTM